MKCKLCDKEFDTFRALGIHISKHHKISTEEYYISNIGKRGICPICGKKTNFHNLKNGYHSYCSIECYKKRGSN